MPIRFRCAYCNQLLGIARRKAGTVVRCPTCAGQVVVPTTEPQEAGASPLPEEPIFERSDFDQVFQAAAEPHPLAVNQGAPPGPAPAPPPAGAWGTHAEPPFDVERLEPSALPPATQKADSSNVIMLSSAKATLIAVAVILAIAVAFGAGFLLGFYSSR